MSNMAGYLLPLLGIKQLLNLSSIGKMMMTSAICWLFSALLLSPGLKAQEINAFTALRTGTVEVNQVPATRLVIEMAAPINAKLFLLDNPYRVVMDVPGADWDAGSLLPAGILDEGPISSYRYGRPDQKTGRLVFELSAPAAPVRAFILPPRDTGGHRLVIDVQDNGRTAFKVAKAALQKQPYIAELENQEIGTTAPVSDTASAPASPQQDELVGKAVSIGQPAPRPKRWVVMIDAGHGG